MKSMHLSFHPRLAIALCCIAMLLPSVGQAEIRLPAVIGDNMVVQAGDLVNLWGWADPNEEFQVKLSWHDAEWTTQADPQGEWSFRVASPEVGGPYKITLTGENTVTIENILAGEVWVCSGQSNMQWSVRQSANAEEEIAAAEYPKIRLFAVERNVAQTPQEDCTGSWVECSPETVAGFSAVGYYFGRELRKKLDMPVGLIHTSWGGTPAEAWTSRTMIERHPACAPILERYKETVARYPEAKAKYDKALEQWEEEAAKAREQGEKPPQKPKRPRGPGHHHSPSGLYNAMVAPLIPYTIRGAIWYQGESNAGRAYQYRELFPAMIRSWWDGWGETGFPFFFVQLANYRQVKDEPAESDWAELREAQLMALNLPNTGMAVTIDIGEADDIHPKNKQDVGKRLALWALAKTYGRDVVYSGPLYTGMEREDGKIVLHFDHVDGGLVAKGDGPLKGFAIAGEDREFVWADARIEGDTVVVSSDRIEEPIAVRYAWADNPVCNLYNEAGLPASPFRTDSWPGITVQNK